MSLLSAVRREIRKKKMIGCKQAREIKGITISTLKGKIKATFGFNATSKSLARLHYDPNQNCIAAKC